MKEYLLMESRQANSNHRSSFGITKGIHEQHIGERNEYKIFMRHKDTR